jgi:hypothetical protein
MCWSIVLAALTAKDDSRSYCGRTADGPAVTLFTDSSKKWSNSRMASVARVAELNRVHAEGLAAGVGAVNPYRGQRVNAAVWRGGYRRMLDDMMANSPARRRWVARYP